MEFQNNYENNNNNYENNNFNYETNPGLAIASMVCGILSIVLCCCYGIVGLILGTISIILGLKYKKENGGRSNGQVLAGIICSIIGLVLSTIMLIYCVYVIVHYEEIMNLYAWLINQKGAV